MDDTQKSAEDLARLTQHITAEVNADLAAKERRRMIRKNRTTGIGAATFLAVLFLGHAIGWW